MFGNVRRLLSCFKGLLKGLILKQEVGGRDEREDELDCSTMNQEHSEDIPLSRAALYPTSKS